MVLFDARGARLLTEPLEVKEGEVISVAFGPEGRIAAGYDGDGGGGVVLFDSRGERLRAAPLEVKEGEVTSVAFGPEGRIAAGYGRVVGGVVLFDADLASWRSKYPPAKPGALRHEPLKAAAGDANAAPIG